MGKNTRFLQAWELFLYSKLLVSINIDNYVVLICVFLSSNVGDFAGLLPPSIVAKGGVLMVGSVYYSCIQSPTTSAMSHLGHASVRSNVDELRRWLVRRALCGQGLCRRHKRSHRPSAQCGSEGQTRLSSSHFDRRSIVSIDALLYSAIP